MITRIYEIKKTDDRPEVRGEKFVLEIPREEVEILDFTSIQWVINAALMQTYFDGLDGIKNKFEIQFEGYGFVNYDYFDYPELKRWVRASVVVGIPWFWLLRNDESSITMSALVACIAAEKVYGSTDEYKFNQKSVENFIGANSIFIDVLSLVGNVPDEITDEVREASINNIWDYISRDTIDLAYVNVEFTDVFYS